jgi:hypothetical protein
MNKHSLGVTYTPAEVILMYGEDYFKRKPRPVKPRIQDFSQFDNNHKETYTMIATKIQAVNQEPIQAWACGSRVKGYWWTPEEDPSKRGSDWDIWTNAKVLPDKKDFPEVRIDWTTGKNPPTHSVRVF